MKRALLIAYRFPPVCGGGTFRPLKFAKYLPQFGWEPIILCAQPTANDDLDPALLDELPNSAVVERVGLFNPKQLERGLSLIWAVLWKARLRAIARQVEPNKLMEWLAPDSFILWALSAYRAARKLVQRYHPDVVLTTSPPHSVQLAGLWLQRSTRIPWIADFRDPWTQNPFLTYRTEWHLRKAKRWEREILAEADSIIAVTDTMAEQFRNLDAGHGAAAKICTITSGFDPSDFAGAVADTSSHCLRIVYTGSLYGLRRADPFLECVDRLVKEGHIPAETIKVEFIGRDNTEAWQGYANKPWFHHLPFQSHKSVIESTSCADLLLLLVPDQVTAQIPGKLFDYLGTSKPILALVPTDSDAARTIRDANAGIVAPPDNPEAISSALLRLYDEWQAGQLQTRLDPTVVASFDWRKLTARLAEVLNTVVAGQSLQ